MTAFPTTAPGDGSADGVTGRPLITPEAYAEAAAAIEAQVGRVIVGQADLVRLVLVCLVCEGHALIEGVPGLGKTVLLKTLSDALSLSFSRLQFTPDLMPADIVGTNVLEEDDAGRRQFRYRGRSSPSWCWPTRSTGPPRRRSRRSSRRWPSGPSPWPARPAASPGRSSSWPP
jgi:MoxR-like ATPase